MSGDGLKERTAGAMKWNFIDRFGTQLLYAVSGIILARILSPEEFGLVGAIVVFQSFASLLVDSGFMPALLQRKNPQMNDYYSVFWFNLIISVALYVGLYFAAPLIADFYRHSTALIPLSRVLFLSIVINALSLVPNNRLLKRMDVRPVALSNSIGLVSGAVVGIWLAVEGFGAWALVWQTITLCVVKGILLWIFDRWTPRLYMSLEILRGYFRFGGAMMFSSFLNTVFLNIYSFVIGNRAGMASLGFYTQGDKWSKMGIMSITQVFQSTFVPALSEVQDDVDRFRQLCVKFNRLTAYIVFPSMLWLILLAPAGFHALFGEKWDSAIPLFALLLIRGVFFLFTQSYNTVIVAKGDSRLVVITEVVRDITALVALAITLPFINSSWEGHPLGGLELLIAGQIVAALAAWIYTLAVTSRITGRGALGMIVDALPYLVTTIISCVPMVLLYFTQFNPWALLALQGVAGLVVYFSLNMILGSAIQKDVMSKVFRIG